MKQNAVKTVGAVIGALLCAVFAFLLICNLTIIIKSKDRFKKTII